MKAIRKALLGMVCCAVFSVSAHAQQLEKWADNHPQASQALGKWVRSHPKAAHFIFEWDGKHPAHSQQLVTWAITHPEEGLMKFYNQHRDWPAMETIMNTHRPGTEAFLKWCRNYHEAARALMMHSGGLKWAGDHLYKSQANM